jgi:hypothetical protein
MSVIAELFLADQAYPVGTVVTAGGSNEVTAAGANDNPMGVVCANPQITLNPGRANSTPIALVGACTILIAGPCLQGDNLAVYGAGMAYSVPAGTPCIFAQALESSTATGANLIQAVLV